MTEVVPQCTHGGEQAQGEEAQGSQDCEDSPESATL